MNAPAPWPKSLDGTPGVAVIEQAIARQIQPEGLGASHHCRAQPRAGQQHQRLAGAVRGEFVAQGLRHDAVTVMDPTDSRQEFDQTLHHEKLSAVVRERFCARRAFNSPLCATA
jgi:hypothetical protein